MSGWLNTPTPIVEKNVSIVERSGAYSGAYGIGGTLTSIVYRRTVTWITTRYVGADYTGAVAFRDALVAQYLPALAPGSNDPTIEASVQAAGGGQYHVVATVHTITPWVLEV